MERDQKKIKYSIQNLWQRKAALGMSDSNQNGFLLWIGLLTGEEYFTWKNNISQIR